MTQDEQEWRWRVRGVAAYLGIQGLGVALWWLGMWWLPWSRAYFRTSRMGEQALLDFAWPDLPLLGVGSLVCAIVVLRAARSLWCQRLLWCLLGATLYPTLYVFGATPWTGGEGWAATMAMLLMAKGTALAIWSIRPEGPLFQVAPKRSVRAHVLRTLVQTAFFWVLALLLTPWLLCKAEATLGIPRFHTPYQAWLPWVLFVLPGIANIQLGYTMSRWGEGTPLPLETARRFVIRGGYRYVRNPMATSGLFLGLMVGWWLGSWLTQATVFAGGLLWHFAVRPLEERDLLARFGTPYAAYCEKVRCWLPRLPPHPPALLPPVDEANTPSTSPYGVKPPSDTPPVPDEAA